MNGVEINLEIQIFLKPSWCYWEAARIIKENENGFLLQIIITYKSSPADFPLAVVVIPNVT